MIRLNRRWGLVLLAGVIAISHANTAQAASIVLDQAAFLAGIAPGSFVQSLTTYNGPTDPLSLSGNGFSYTIVSSTSLYGLATVGLGALNNTDTLTVSFTSGNVTAVGGNFFTTAGSGNPPPPDGGGITLTLSDGTIVNLSETTLTSFAGFLSSSPITSLTIASIGPSADGNYPTFANFDVGMSAAVPEPATLGLLGGALVALGLLRKRIVR